MHQSRRVFHAVSFGQAIGNNQVGDLLKWLERFAQLCFPDSQVEYWCNSHDIYAQAVTAPENPFVSPALPLESCRRDVASVSVTVAEGRSEGMRLAFRLHPREAALAPGRILVEAKLFESRDRCWEIARAVAEALESILLCNEVPDLVDMGACLPIEARTGGTLSRALTHVTLRSTPTSVSVMTGSGEQLCHQVCGPDTSPTMAQHRVAALIKDWFFVLTNAGVSRIDFDAVS